MTERRVVYVRDIPEAELKVLLPAWVCEEMVSEFVVMFF